jgi:phosphatidylinositol-3-phosphatase
MWSNALSFVRVCVAVLGCALIVAPATPIALDAQTVPPPYKLPPIRHVFTIILENQTFDSTFGSTLPVPYLAKDVAGKGALLTQYYATSHFSLGNYLTLISGEAVTRANQDDCATSSEYPELSTNYADIDVKGPAPYGQVTGDGCIYPPATKTIADQLTAKGLTWHGYMEDLGNDTTRETVRCGQPIGGVGAPDNTQYAQVPPHFTNGGLLPVSDQYAARHNPFVYFHSLIDSKACADNVGPLGTPQKSPLADALRSIATTPNYTFITPNLCDDGHDTPCHAPRSPVGVHMYDPENAFLQTWVPIITRSPAFQKDGLLIITFDESSLAGTSASGVQVGYDGAGCCGEPSGPNTNTPGMPPLNAPQYRTGAYSNEIITLGSNGISGGGRTGTVLVSPFINPGQVSAHPYNHYSTLRTIEDIFGLPHLGYAGYPGTPTFGADVFGAIPDHFPVTL